MSNNNIILPSAADLDTGDTRDSSHHTRLYLIPAEEAPSGVATITVIHGIGHDGIPEPAYHGRWLRIGRYDGRVCGHSLRKILLDHAAELAETASAYHGSEWDGNHRVGVWARNHRGGVWAHLELDLADAARYWEASEWIEGAYIEVRAQLRDEGIESILDALMDHADSEDVCIDENDLRDVLTEMVAEIEEEVAV